MSYTIGNLNNAHYNYSEMTSSKNTIAIRSTAADHRSKKRFMYLKKWM